MGIGPGELLDSDRRKPAPSRRDDHGRQEVANGMARPTASDQRNESAARQQVTHRRAIDWRGPADSGRAYGERLLSRWNGGDPGDGRWKRQRTDGNHVR